MHTRNLPFSAQFGRYKHLAKKVNRLLKTGAFQLLSLKEQRSLLTRLRGRLRRIGHLIPQPKMKSALAGISFLLGVGFANPLAAQQFAPAIASPFGFEPGTTAGYESFADLDGDGDLDLAINSYDYYAQSYKFLLFENVGTAQSPAFTADNYQINPYGIVGAYLSQPNFVDIDNDGDLDLISGALGYGGFQFQENIGSATAPQFEAPILNPFGLQPTSPYESASFADLDNDGDLDILSGGGSGHFSFFENTGSNSAPSFAAPIASPFGLSEPGEISIPHLADLDGDGDYDLISLTGDYYGLSMTYWENTGTAGSPSFGTSINNPFGISLNGLYIAFPTAADIDGDGDMDVFVNDYFGSNIYFYQNLNINVEYPPTSVDNTIISPEDAVYLFDGTDFSFSDPNLGEQLKAVQITELPANGTIKLGSNLVTNGQIIQVSELPNLNYKPALNEFGTTYTTFKFKVYDGSLWSLDEYTTTFNITPVNDAPSTLNAEVTGSKEFAYVFESADFPYSDIENQPMANVKINSLPAKGNLKLNGTNITAGQVIAMANIQNLAYSGLPGEFGPAYTSFGFSVSDGAAYSAQATMTINLVETSSTEEASLNVFVKLAPNPVSSMLNFHLEAAARMVNPSLTVFDGIGRVLKTVQLSPDSQIIDYQLDVNELSDGFYFVKIESEEKFTIAKFVKG